MIHLRRNAPGELELDRIIATVTLTADTFDMSIFIKSQNILSCENRHRFSSLFKAKAQFWRIRFSCLSQWMWILWTKSAIEFMECIAHFKDSCQVTTHSYIVKRMIHANHSSWPIFQFSLLLHFCMLLDKLDAYAFCHMGSVDVNVVI